MKAKYKSEELAAVVYADIFGYPLTTSEAKLWAIRNARKKNSEIKLALAKEMAQSLKKIPTIQGIFLTGSVAAQNAKREADVDLMIVTIPGTLWLTRLIIIWLLKKNHLYKTVICPNIFLDTKHLEIKNKNLYTAHEVLQAKCLYDKGNINYLWLKNNEWTKGYLPKAYAYYVSRIKYHAPKYIIHNTLYIIPELIAFILQYLYQKPKQTNERIGWGYAFFHPRDLSEKVVGEFERRLSFATKFPEK